MERSEIEYLFKNYYRYTQQRDALMEQVEDLMAKATKITPNFDPEKVGSAPITNPKPSKVEKYAVKIVNAKEKIRQLEILIGGADELFKALRPHQKYLVKCCVCNGMKPEDFSAREGIKPLSVKHNLDAIYKKLEALDD